MKTRPRTLSPRTRFHILMNCGGYAHNEFIFYKKREYLNKDNKNTLFLTKCAPLKSKPNVIACIRLNDVV